MMTNGLESFTARRGISRCGQIAAVATAASLALACGGTQSQYVPKHAPAGEITWGWDDGLTANKDGKEVSRGQGWDGLPEAVECVPRAQELAADADSSASTGSGMLWGGVGAMVGGMAVGIGLAAADTDNVGTGIGVMIAGLVGGAVLMIIGGNKIGGAQTKAVDAVNIYNDEYGASPQCAGGDSGTPVLSPATAPDTAAPPPAPPAAAPPAPPPMAPPAAPPPAAPPPVAPPAAAPPPAAPPPAAPPPPPPPPAAAAPAPAARQSNLLSNGGIEYGTSPWVGFGARAWASGVNPHSGTACLNVGDRNSPRSGVTVSLVGKVSPGHSYLLSAWVHVGGTGTDTANIVLDYTDKTGRHFLTVATATVGQQWVKLAGKLNLPVGYEISKPALLVNGPAAGAILYVDDVSMTLLK